MSATRAYRSKIGRLPFRLRTELNERIRDGATGAAVLEWLNATPEMAAVRAETGCGDVNPQNLTDWRGTGYKDWLTEMDKTERLRSMAEFSQTVMAQTGQDPTAVGARILTAKLLDVLETADPVTQGELVKAFASLRAGETDAQRTQLAREKNDLARQALALSRQKFQRETCKLFLDWYDDQQAKTVVGDPSLNNDAKTEALGRLMFRDLWDPQKT